MWLLRLGEKLPRLGEELLRLGEELLRPGKVLRSRGTREGGGEKKGERRSSQAPKVITFLPLCILDRPQTTSASETQTEAWLVKLSLLSN